MQQYRMDLGEDAAPKEKASKSTSAKAKKTKKKPAPTQKKTVSKKKTTPKTKPKAEPVQPQLNTVGGTLKSAREEMGMSLTHASAALNMRMAYLVAIEEDNFGSLPPSYVKGFVRTYAALVKRDGEQLIQQLSAAVPLQNVKHSMPEPIETHVMPSKTVLVASVVIFIAVLAALGFFFFKPVTVDVMETLELEESPLPESPTTEQH